MRCSFGEQHGRTHGTTEDEWVGLRRSGYRRTQAATGSYQLTKGHYAKTRQKYPRLRKGLRLQSRE